MPLLISGSIFFRLTLLSAFVLAICAGTAQAQTVSLTTPGSAYTQNFDTLSNTAGSTTNNLTIPGWFMTESGGGARDNEQYGVDTGGSTTGDTYSYGSAASTDRALGGLRSGTLIPIFGAAFTNNTGSTITSLTISYTGEQWRLGTSGRTDQINFEYSTNATDLVTGTWTGVAALNFVTPDTVTTGAKNGNAAADRTALSTTITGLSIPNGATFWIRWTDTDATGADDGLAVDDFSLTPNTVVQPNLSINDVSLNEGNAGTTSYTFTVSLSAPAGPGGVTFDIATADGTATQPGDYTQKSLTAQTIPAGSSTYSFTVLVNGDTTPETNETFFVNVTNVTGATVTDGQGQGTIVNDDAAPNLTINDVSLNEGNAGTTTFTFTVSLSAPAPAGGVTFDIATANSSAVAPGDYTAKSLTSQTIPAGSSTYTFDVLVNGDTTPELDETFFVNVTNATNAIVTDGQGQGTIVNDDITKIHDVQGNGAATPIPGSTVTVEGVVTTNFQGTSKLQGFFLQEEDADNDADPATSEGIFIFCNTCPTAVAEGQRVRATGTVSEFNNMTEITASTAGSVVVTDAGNHLAEVTPATIDLPIVGDINSFYESREGMLVTFVDTLSVADYSELGRFGQIELYEGGRPRQFTETASPNAAGYTTHLDNLDRRRVILDDDNNTQNAYLSKPDGQQAVFYPQANGGFSVGTQGTDFFRGGDLVNGLTGVLHWSFPGFGADTWRIRPTAAHPVTFTVANPRPATPPAVGGTIKVASMNLLNYFTTIDTTSSNNSGPCGPSGTQDCRGADSVAELNRQRDRASIAICALNADVVAFMELENTTPSDTINDLLGAVNTRCGGMHPYAFVNTGGTLGTDAIRVQLIYRTGVVSPVGSPLVDLDPIHNRPPTAQTFDVVDATNLAFGERFTVIANHFKSKGCDASATGADADSGDGQGCYAGRRTDQASRLLTWINGTVLPAAGDPDVLLLGDFNSYAQETPVTTLTSGGFTDVETALLGTNAYSYVFDGQLGHLDYAFANNSLFAKVTGVGAWHINADEVDLFDYNDEVKDTGEATFEEKPDGSALVPPRVVFQPSSVYRASDHDPVLLGLFPDIDLVISKTHTGTFTQGGTASFTLKVSNNGNSDSSGAYTISDTMPAGLTINSVSSQGSGWDCSASTMTAVSCTRSTAISGSGSAPDVIVNVNIASNASASITNTASVSGGGEFKTDNNSSSDTVSVTQLTDVTINVPAGVSFTLNSVVYTGTQTVKLEPGMYTLSTTTPQSLGAGTRAVFNSWSDMGAISHQITVGSSPLSITGNFTTQYQLTTAAGTGGTVSPASGAFYDSGTVVNVMATPDAGYNFSNWTGPVANANAASTTVTMNSPVSITANFVANNQPTITPAVLARTQNSVGANILIATANDVEDAVNTLQLQISDGGVSFGNSATVNGVTITLTDSNGAAAGTNPNASGQVLATISTSSTATTASFTLKVTDSGGLSDMKTLTVTVIPFTASISDPFACNGAGGTVTVTAFLTNPDNTLHSASFAVTLPTELNVVNNSCTSTTGSCSTTLPKQINWSGTLLANETVQIQYQAQIVNGVLPGQLLTIDSLGIVNGLQVTTSASATVSCPADSLTNPPVNVALSDQKAGSLLVFPYYTSDASGNFTQADTLFEITNVSNSAATLANGAPNYQYLHLFFINKDCSPADTFICLTPGGSLQFKASEFDPLTTGYLIAVAVDEQGRPTQNNAFIGAAYVRNDQAGLIDSYGAESFWKHSTGAVPTNTDGSATVYFDGVNYDLVPIQFSTPLQDPNRATQTLVLASLSGDLGTKLNSTSQNLTGAIYRDDEALASFTNGLGSGCLIERGLTSTNIRLTPSTLTGFLKDRFGYLKFNLSSPAVGLILSKQGSSANYPNLRFAGIRTLHKTAVISSSLKLPIFAPFCQ